MATLSILAGPAGSGKTARLLALYRSALRAGPIGSVLWLTPTARAGRDLRGRLLDGELRGCLRPGIHTFAHFADAILEHAGIAVRPITNWQKRELLEQLVDQGLAEKRLKYFAPIAQTDGFLDQLTGFVSELKRLEIWPDEFYSACQRRGMGDKDRELFTLYDEYQTLLMKHRLYDSEGRFWEARERLVAGQTRPFNQLRLVVVDGFTDFTRTQHEMLELLAPRVDTLWVSLPLEQHTERADLFAKSQGTLTQLQRRHAGARVEWLDRAEPSPWPALEHIERHIFGNPRRIPPPCEITNIEILPSARQEGELETVARRIKRLIVAGVPPGNIVVVFRHVAELAPLVREVFTRLGLPFVVETARRLREAPGVRALGALLRLSVSDWPFREVLAALGNSLIDWGLLPPQTARGVAAAQLAVRELQIHRGVRPLLERVGRRVAATPQMLADANTETAEEFPLALPILSRLRDWLAALPARATPADWTAALRRLAEGAGLTREPDVAWDTFWSALEESDELPKLLGAPPPVWDATQALEQLEQIVNHTSLPDHDDDTGCVRVLSAQSVRALRVPYLFVAELAEKAFPPSNRDDRLYGDAEYRALKEQGLNLIDRAERGQEEMLLFYEVITRATRKLFLSYPALDDKAQPLSPSPYLTEVERVCAAHGIPHSAPPDLTPTAHAADLLCPADWRLLAVQRGVEGNAEGVPSAAELLAGLRKSQPDDAMPPHLAAGLRLIQARSSGDTFGAFEGLLTNDAIRHELAKRYGGEHCWSASQLEEYAYCPHQFYLHRVLNLRPLPELTLSQDYLGRGSLLHEVVATLHRNLNAEHGGPFAAGTLDVATLQQLFDETVAACFAELPAGGPLSRALAEINRRTVVEWGPNYVEQTRRYDAPPDPGAKTTAYKPPLAPAFFEVGFGPKHGEEAADPRSRAEPFTLQHDGESIRVAGRIDRIDVGRVGGQMVFNVIDYKTGGATPLKLQTVESGGALQLPLYALVAQEMLLVAESATPWQIGYWFVKENGFSAKQALTAQTFDGRALSPAEGWEQLKSALVNRVVSIVRGIRAAEFPVYCADEKCTSQCDFHTVCRIHQVRNLRKVWPPSPPENPS